MIMTTIAQRNDLPRTERVPKQFFFFSPAAIDCDARLKRWLELHFPSGDWPPVVSAAHILCKGQAFCDELLAAIGNGNLFVLLPECGYPPELKVLNPCCGGFLESICVKRHP